MNDNEFEFIESLYKLAEEELKKIYEEKKNNRTEVLNFVANILLIYTITNNFMDISKNNKKKEYEIICKKINDIFNSDITNQQKIINDLLNTVVKNTYIFYNYNFKLKDVKKIIDNNFAGKHFSTRIWNNESKTARVLNKKIKDFLNGKINVNQIKSDIENIFNTSAYNSKRLVETEVSRCETEAFKQFCYETEVKKVKRIAVMDARTCEDCMEYDNKIYTLKDAPNLPEHPLCRCYLSIWE